MKGRRQMKCLIRGGEGRVGETKRTKCRVGGTEASERSRGGTEAEEVPHPGEVAWSDEAGEMLRPEARGWRRERGGLLACKRIAAD